MSSKRAVFQLFNYIYEICSQRSISAYFVGGCVRDALLGICTTDFDLAVEPDAFEILYDNLNQKYHIKKSVFSTFSLNIGDYNIDVAAFRTESYEAENGLPKVEYANIEQDIYRRDFTINTGYVLISDSTIRIMLSNQEKDHLKIDYCHKDFWEDIQNRQIRIMHPSSFIQDASRLLRAVKYQVTLNMSLEVETMKCFNSSSARTALLNYSMDRYKQIVLDYALSHNGVIILDSLYKNSLLIHIKRDTNEDALSNFSSIYDEIIDKISDEKVVNEIKMIKDSTLYLLYLYRNQLEFWKNQRRFMNILIDEIQKILAGISGHLHLDAWQIYQLLNGKSLSSIVFVLLVTKQDDINTLDLDSNSIVGMILEYLNKTRHIIVNLTGSSLKNFGLIEGKEIGQMLEKLLKYKVSEKHLMTSEEEINWIVSKINEHRY